MKNITILTGMDLKNKNSDVAANIYSIINNTSDTNKKVFIKELTKYLPTYILELLTIETLNVFLDTLYNYLKERANSSYCIKELIPSDHEFSIGNHSALVLITDDRPFLVDSIREYFFSIKYDRFFLIHPIFKIEKDGQGNIKKISKPTTNKNNLSFVVVFLENVNGNFLKSAASELNIVYKEVVDVVDNFPIMEDRVKFYINKCDFIDKESIEFLQWLRDKNFIFMGIREIKNFKNTIEVKNYGLFKDKRIKFDSKHLLSLVTNNEINLIDNHPMHINKVIFKSTVKRRENFDFISLIDNKSEEKKFYIIIGLFTNSAIRTSPFNISLVSAKLKNIFSYFNFIEGTHDYKWLEELLMAWPKAELFNFSKDTFVKILNIIFSLSVKNQISIYWEDLLPQRHLYLFIAAPIEKYSYELVEKISNELKKIFNADLIDISIRQDEHGFFFIFFHFYLYDIEVAKNIDEKFLKNTVVSFFKNWDEELFDIMSEKLPDKDLEIIHTKYLYAFTNNYKTKNEPFEAYLDILSLEKLERFACQLYINSSQVVLKVYAFRKILLTELMPIINDTGLSVFEEEIFNANIDNRYLYIHTFYLAEVDDKEKFVNENKANVESLITSILSEKVISDRINCLAIKSRLNWREIDFLRALRNYIEQLQMTVKRLSINNTLINNPSIIRLFITYMHEKFDPHSKQRTTTLIEKQILDLIDKVESVNEDKILRYYFIIIKNILRTNFYMTPERDSIAFKIDSKKIPFMCEPKPLYEIYVHGYMMKGIHLRAGKIARGGIRLSNRIDDFRFEILGLMKTQIIKNAIIVPTGAKGGFVIEKAKFNSKVEYKKFISGLLDITDNYKNGMVKNPKNVVCYDDFDPYLVVAADKGTATFSDLANEIAEEYTFWLKDAFASGGSAGYDHKELGITARGAWESVKRHFKELGKNIVEETFTVIGIGDMSGDVFGNEMLLSNNIKLLAAFNHKDIFIDPDPDPEVSFKERLRLFRLFHSSWTDYNKTTISAGGGIYSRDAKKIELTIQVKNILNIDKNELTGEELIKAILKMKADLLWNGGIGTYIKDRSESNSDVSDTANDYVRINADELQVAVVGEGGNLGFTQKGRIAYALKGGKINTDSLDNSAGVDTSDHEVNLKILLNNLATSNVIDNKEKLTLIKNSTEHIVKNVLNDNFEQSLVVSLDELFGIRNKIDFELTANLLSKENVLDIGKENINFIKENRAPTRPELSVLLGYTKIYLYNNIVESIDVNNPYVKDLYTSYFPVKIVKAFENFVLEHQLHKNIAATALVNNVINKAGITFLFNLNNPNNYFLSMVNYLAASEILSTNNIRNQLLALDQKDTPDAIYNILISINKILKDAVDYINLKGIEILLKNIKIFRKILTIMPDSLTDLTQKKFTDYCINLHRAGLPDKLVKDSSNLCFSDGAFDIFDIVVSNNYDIKNTIKNHYFIDEAFKINQILEAVEDLPVKNIWDKIALNTIHYKYKKIHKELTYKICRENKIYLNNMKKNEVGFFKTYDNFLKALQNNEIDSLVPFNVIVDNLSKIVFEEG